MNIRGTLEKLEVVFGVLTLLLSTESFILLIPHALRQLFWLSVYGITAILLVARWKTFIEVAGRAKLLWLLIGIVLLSVTWSDSPSATVRQSIALMGTTFFGLYLSTRYTLKEQLRLLGWVFGIAVVLSFVFAIALPSYGLQGGQSWQGIYHHKNLLGRIMVLSTIVFLLNAQSSKTYRWVSWGGMGLSIVLLILSNSKTSLALFLLLLALLWVYRILRLYYKLAVPVLSVALVMAGGAFLIAIAQAETVVGAAGKDLTFSGRTDLWDLVIPKIYNRFWFGHGYGGFWLGWSGESADIWFLETWLPKHSHNGYIDLWLDIGFVGMVVFALGMLFVLYRATLWVSLTRTPEYLLPLAFLNFVLLYNLTESVWLLQNTLFWIFYVTTICNRLEPPETPSPPVPLAFAGGWSDEDVW
ncbi:MAG: O-antigen ligase family protein [Cyanobacteria bacterium P01_A01_bin.37]